MPVAEDHIDIVIVSPSDDDVSLQLETNDGTAPEVRDQLIVSAGTFVFNRQLKNSLLSPPSAQLEINAQVTFNTTRIESFRCVPGTTGIHAIHYPLNFAPGSGWMLQSSTNASKSASVRIALSGSLAGAALTPRVSLRQPSRDPEVYDISFEDSGGTSYAHGELEIPGSWALLS